jgi:hypothetical protein
MKIPIINSIANSKTLIFLFFKEKICVQGTVQFLSSFFRGVFSDLKDPHNFRQVMVVDGVVTWPGERDLAPDALYQQLKKQGTWVLG